MCLFTFDCLQNKYIASINEQYKIGHEQEIITFVVLIAKFPLDNLLNNFEEIDQHHMKCGHSSLKVSLFYQDSISNFLLHYHRNRYMTNEEM